MKLTAEMIKDAKLNAKMAQECFNKTRRELARQMQEEKLRIEKEKQRLRLERDKMNAEQRI